MYSAPLSTTRLMDGCTLESSRVGLSMGVCDRVLASVDVALKFLYRDLCLDFDPVDCTARDQLDLGVR